MVKNLRIRRKMAELNVSQAKLGKMLGMTQPEISALLRMELAKKEQDGIIKKMEGYRNEEEQTDD